MPKKKKAATSLTGPIDLPTPTLFYLGLLLAMVGLTLVIYPNFWFPKPNNVCAPPVENQSASDEAIVRCDIDNS
jgi:hypothetical protein